METSSGTSAGDGVVLILTVLALALNAGALFYAGRQFATARRAAAAGSLVPIAESFRQAWLEYKRSTDEQEKKHTFADIANLLEMSCAIYQDGLLTGRAGNLLRDYLIDVLRLIQKKTEYRDRLQGLLVDPKNFVHIREFVGKHKRQLNRIIVVRSGSDELHIMQRIRSLIGAL